MADKGRMGELDLDFNKNSEIKARKYCWEYPLLSLVKVDNNPNT